jgi:hypothetical protein
MVIASPRFSWLAMIALAACDLAPLAPDAGVASHEDTAALAPALEASVRSQQDPATRAVPTAIGFDWGAPCRVPATQDVVKENISARFKFDVVLTREGDRFVVRIEKLRTVPMPGIPTPAALDRVTTLLGSSSPPVAVALSGKSLGAVEVDRAIDAMILLLSSTGLDTTTVGKVTELLRSPQWKTTLIQRAGDDWTAWVGIWSGSSLMPHTERSSTHDLPGQFGTIRGVLATLAHHGYVVGEPDLVLLSFKQVIEGPDFEAFARNAVKDMGEHVGVDVDEPEFSGARKVDFILAAFEPTTGRPHRVRRETTTGFGNQSKLSTRDTAFDWSHTIGCVSATAK